MKCLNKGHYNLVNLWPTVTNFRCVVCLGMVDRFKNQVLKLVI